ncbi:MAG: hypothetical protein ACKVK3_02620 [Acidimicrobiales bacterium]
MTKLSRELMGMGNRAAVRSLGKVDLDLHGDGAYLVAPQQYIRIEPEDGCREGFGEVFFGAACGVGPKDASIVARR